MVGRFEILCAVTIASWLAGIALELYWDPRHGWGLVAPVMLGFGGLVAAPAIGFRLVTGLPELADWESWGARDFFPVALAVAAPICFFLSFAVCWAIAG